jgi:ABC-type multidrug transport system fused ATPase/permease subunit
MVRLIEEEFTSQTVILVTHRLHAIKNYDRVVVMDAGRILEDGSPQVLLSDVNSVFYKLYHKR